MFSSVFLFIMLLAFKHTHLISDLDVFPCIPLLLLSSCTFRAFFDKPPCPTSLNIVLYPSHWQPPLRVPRQKRQPPSLLSASWAVSRNISRNQRTREPKEKALVRYLNRTVLGNEFAAWPSE